MVGSHADGGWEKPESNVAAGMQFHNRRCVAGAGYTGCAVHLGKDLLGFGSVGNFHDRAGNLHRGLADRLNNGQGSVIVLKQVAALGGLFFGNKVKVKGVVEGIVNGGGVGHTFGTGRGQHGNGMRLQKAAYVLF